MSSILGDIPLIIQTIIAGIICWLCTSTGAGFVFLFKQINKKLTSALLAFAGGVMIASSFFSLLNPAIESCETNNLPAFLFVAFGFFVGGSFIIISSKILDKFIKFDNNAKGKGLKRSIMLFSSITIHNIPEGMAVGVAFGSLMFNTDVSCYLSAFMLAIGIGIQNIPEGASVSLPLKNEGFKTGKAFGIGVLSGVVEPIFAPLAFLLCMYLVNILPFLLSFSAGTMIAVATCELMPEAVANSKHRAVLYLTIGFVVMALLDLALG